MSTDEFGPLFKGIEYRETSRQAWQTFQPISGQLDREIVAVIRRLGGATCQHIELETGRSHQAVSGNIRHLVERGILIPTERRGLTSSGRKAIVWELRRGNP